MKFSAERAPRFCNRESNLTVPMAKSTDGLLNVSRLEKKFPVSETLFRSRRRYVHAVNGVSLTLEPGKTVGLVGESGCGKSTVARLICLLDQPTSGEICFEGRELAEFSARERQAYHRSVQLVFQNPYASLNPRMRVGQALREVFKVHRICSRREMDSRVAKLLETVGLSPESQWRFPFEFSGGQRQRLCLARALAVEPAVIVCDEPVSALDVSVQAQILKLLKVIQQQRNLAYLFISHDLSVVYHICDEVLVMYAGRIVERGPVETIFREPRHPYTQALLSAIPTIEADAGRKRIVLTGELPDLNQLPPGCPFYSRCFRREPVCQSEKPPLISHGSQQTECWLYAKHPESI